MKKVNKVVAGVMLLGMGAGVAGALPIQNIQTVSAQTSSQFTVGGFDTSLTIGQTITLPEVAGVTRTVIDPMGKVLSLTNNELFASKLGTYTVRYVKAIDNSKGKTVYEYQIKVTGDKPELQFATNDSRIIPEITNFEHDVVLPVPTVLNADGEVIENAEVSVEITDPAGAKTNVTNAQLTAQNGYTLDISKNGDYYITYKYVNSHNTLAYKTFTVEGKESYDESNIQLTHTFNSEKPTSINLGSEVTLPSVTLKNKNASDAKVSAYYDIKVVHVESNQEYTVTDHKFVPKQQGQYRVTYTINDFFGSKIEGTNGTNTVTFTIDKCTDTTAPQPMVVTAYTQTAVTGQENVVRVAVDSLQNAETSIISKVYLDSNATVTFPAIFATDDNEVKRDGEYYQFNKNNVTLTRRIVDENGSTVKSWSSSEAGVDAFGTVEHTFTEAGSYKIQYTARDSAGNSRTITFPFEVIDESNKDVSAPTISFDDIQLSYAMAGEKISFKKPTVVDYLDAEADNKVIGDTRVETSTYYYFNEDVANKVEIKEDKDNSENLAFTLPEDLTGKSKVTIITYAKDDYHAETSNSYSISIVGNTADADAPVINDEIVLSGDTFTAGTEDSIDQLKTVTIGDIELTDADENFGAQISVRYFQDENDELGSEIALESVTTVHDKANKKITLKNASFVATNVGTYVVTVIGQDLAGNTIIKSTTVKTLDTVAPEIFVNWPYTNVELGETITLPQAQVYDDNKLLPNANVVIEIQGPGSASPKGNQFTPTVKGTYTVKYYSEDASGNPVESQAYLLIAEDTTKPVIEIDGEFPSRAALNQDNNGNNIDTVIYIPGFTATDVNGIEWENDPTEHVKVKKGSTEYDVTVSGDGYTFTTKQNGTYDVTYTVTDNSGHVTEVKKSIQVGDVTAPVITIGNASKNKPGSKQVGDKLELDLESITVTDNIDENLNGISLKDAIADSDITASVTVYCNGSIVEKTVEDEAEYYKLDKQGTYRIVYSVTDENGIRGEEEHSFTVNAKPTSPKITTETLGIILIVASLLLLGGVVIYFFATRKVVRRPKKD